MRLQTKCKTLLRRRFRNLTTTLWGSLLQAVFALWLRDPDHWKALDPKIDAGRVRRPWEKSGIVKTLWMQYVFLDATPNDKEATQRLDTLMADGSYNYLYYYENLSLRSMWSALRGSIENCGYLSLRSIDLIRTTDSDLDYSGVM